MDINGPSSPPTTPSLGPGVSLRTSSEHVDLLAAINELHRSLADAEDGEVADYIPELAKVDPASFGISVTLCDGSVYSVGDADRKFTLQSVSSPFVYGHVIETWGRASVREHVGVEPTGNAFNAIVLDRKTRRPMNPMVNAGAIAIASMFPGDDQTDRLNHLLELFERYMGRRPVVDMEVFMSERSTGDRNRAIAYLMQNFGSLEGKIDESLDLYFQQCSLVATATDVSVMAATLANGGVNPVTGVRAIERGPLRDVLTILCTCGLYEVSGRWAYEAGLPSKSGVSGAFMAVVPGYMGIAVYSPRLDAAGNSVRGLLVCRLLSERLGLHMLAARAPRLG